MVDSQSQSTFDNVIKIDQLNDDCLIYIFSFLPIIDRVKIQRVCVRWRGLSQVAWQTLKSFYLKHDFWGISKTNNIIIDRNVFKQILLLCGRFITHIDLSMGDEYSERRIRVQSCKTIFTNIYEMCPHIRSINMGRPCSESTTEFVATHFNKLTHFAVEMVRKEDENCLALLFLNNKNLIHVNMVRCFFSSKCLLDLNLDALEEFHLDECSIGSLQYLLTALERFKSLHTLRLTCCRSDQMQLINPVIQAISSSSQYLRKLNLSFYDCSYEYINYTSMAKLRNLETLCLAGNPMVNDELLTIIGSNCIKLTNVQLRDSDLATDAGFSSITSLPNLQYFYVSSLEKITDAVLIDVPKLRELKCNRCSKIMNDGLCKLLQNSQNIETIRLRCCNKISASEFIDNAVSCARNKLTVEIDSSEIEFDFVTSIYTMTKFHDHIIRKTKKTCYICFKRQDKDDTCSYCCDVEQIFNKS